MRTPSSTTRPVLATGEPVDDVLAFVGFKASQVRALEVGAGTGKATMSFARRGVDIVALEPSAAMAAVAKGNCGGFPNVRVEVTSFEGWPLEAGAFHLVFAAQSRHWVGREVRCVKAADALVADGTLRPVLAPDRLARRTRTRRP